MGEIEEIRQDLMTLAHKRNGNYLLTERRRNMLIRAAELLAELARAPDTQEESPAEPSGFKLALENFQKAECSRCLRFMMEIMNIEKRLIHTVQRVAVLEQKIAGTENDAGA